MSVVLPASGCEMIANVRRRSVSRARTVSGDLEVRGPVSVMFVLGIYAKFTISRGQILDAMNSRTTRPLLEEADDGADGNLISENAVAARCGSS